MRKWLKAQPPERTFDFVDPWHCPIASFIRESLKISGQITVNCRRAWVRGVGYPFRPWLEQFSDRMAGLPGHTLTAKQALECL